MKYFYIEEFTAEELISPRTADLILKYHIEVMVPVREEYKEPIVVSEKSGYRSLQTELLNCRSGGSEHTFEGKGAADYTGGDLHRLGDLLLKTSYKRICFYPKKKFYHCDYKGSERKAFMCEDNVNWKLIGNI